MKACFKKTAALLLAFLLGLGTLSGCVNPGKHPTVVGEHELGIGTESLKLTLNPHAYAAKAEQELMQLLSSALVSVLPVSAEGGGFQWIFEMADSVTDVTQLHTDDLVKYAVSLPYGVEAASLTRGYVYEIRLNPNARWEDGTPITADDYIFSMKALLDPEMKNERARAYYGGSGALAGAWRYYSYEINELENYTNAAYQLSDLVKGEDGVYTTPEGFALAIATQDGLRFLDDYSLQTFVDYYGYLYFDVSAYKQLIASADEKGRVAVTDESLALLTAVITKNARWGDTAEDAVNYLIYSQPSERFEYEDTVGLYQADAYTLRYVTQNYTDSDTLLAALTESWLVKRELYEAGRSYSESQLFVTDYGTGMDAFKSCGPYRIESWNEAEMVLVQNENWYGWEKKDGFLVSYTHAQVDGEYLQQYQSTKIILKKLSAEAQAEAFSKGELSLLCLAEGAEAPKGGTLYRELSGGVRSFFFNTNEKTLKKLDKSGNRNSAVLTDDAFRRAMSLALDREGLAALCGGEAAYGLMNSLFTLAPFTESAVSYRETAEAGRISELYQDDPVELFRTALAELTSRGLYSGKDEIVLRVAWSDGPLTEADTALAAAVSEMISDKAEAAGFGKVTLEPVGGVTGRYKAVPEGDFAIGFGSWDGGALAPYRYMQLFLDGETYAGKLSESACWNPAETELMLKLNESSYVMSYQDWSRSLFGDGRFANADDGTKLFITASLERGFLEMSYRIPVLSSARRTLLADGMHFITDSYSLMYGYGGIRLLQYE